MNKKNNAYVIAMISISYSNFSNLISNIIAL